MKLNEQAPEKRVVDGGGTLAVNSVFHTIQGEGPFAGTPAVFVRLAGCNLQCPLCDTEYTSRHTYTVDELMEQVCDEAGNTTTLVVITGGEPFRQFIGRLASRILAAGMNVQVETNGTLFQPQFPYLNDGVTIVCSPKTGTVHRELLPWVKAWKYVATADSLNPIDGLPDSALDHPSAPRLFRPPADHPAIVFLQPVDEKNIQTNQANQAAVVASCLQHGYRLCLQLHKIIGLD